MYTCTPRQDNIHINIIHTHYVGHIEVGKTLPASAIAAAATFFELIELYENLCCIGSFGLCTLHTVRTVLAPLASALRK